MTDYPQCEHTAQALEGLMALPLNEKIFESRMRIAEWVKIWGEDFVYVAFSGGKDSTVLLDLVRRDYPSVNGCFVDTGLEFPEIREFVKSVENVDWIKPKINFKSVLEKYGYPVVSKRVAQYVHEVINSKGESPTKTLRLTGYKKDGSFFQAGKIPNRWMFLLDAPFKISHKCCDIIKKDPAKSYEKRTNKKPFVGTMTEDSQTRRQSYLKSGCNAFELKRPRSAPISFWTQSDIWEYIKTRNIKYSSIYDLGWDRTGCIFCAFGASGECGENRFQRLKKTHPKYWNFCINKLNMGEILDYIGVDSEENQMMLNFEEKD